MWGAEEPEAEEPREVEFVAGGDQRLQDGKGAEWRGHQDLGDGVKEAERRRHSRRKANWPRKEGSQEGGAGQEQGEAGYQGTRNRHQQGRQGRAIAQGANREDGRGTHQHRRRNQAHRGKEAVRRAEDRRQDTQKGLHRREHQGNRKGNPQSAEHRNHCPEDSQEPDSNAREHGQEGQFRHERSARNQGGTQDQGAPHPGPQEEAAGNRVQAQQLQESLRGSQERPQQVRQHDPEQLAGPRRAQGGNQDHPEWAGDPEERERGEGPDADRVQAHAAGRGAEAGSQPFEAE